MSSRVFAQFQWGRGMQLYYYDFDFDFCFSLAIIPERKSRWMWESTRVLTPSLLLDRIIWLFVQTFWCFKNYFVYFEICHCFPSPIWTPHDLTLGSIPFAFCKKLICPIFQWNEHQLSKYVLVVFASQRIACTADHVSQIHVQTFLSLLSMSSMPIFDGVAMHLNIH